MGSLAPGPIRFRPLTADDLGQVPMDCHGEPAELVARIADLGAAAILAFDGDQHVGQLQFRRHRPGLRSAAGVFSPDYWGDFGGRVPALPGRTLCVYCYHVGQLSDGKARDARYQGHGLGAALLDAFIAWAEANQFAAIVAKSMPADPGVMQFMGGQPERVYAARGFSCLDRWTDLEMYDAVVERGLVASRADPEDVACVGLWVRELRPGR
jgi:GNAT superfamily N-acetyltransferase